VDDLEKQLFQSKIPSSPSKWVDLIAECAPECSAFRLEFARGNRGTFLTRGEQVEVIVKEVEGRMIIQASSEGVTGDFNPGMLADEIYMEAWRVWQDEHHKNPKLKLLRCKLAAIGKQNEVMAEEVVRLQPRKENPRSMADMWATDDELDEPGGTGSGRTSRREDFQLRQHNHFLIKTVEHLVNVNLETMAKAGDMMNNALGMVQTNAVQVVERIRMEKRELEEERDARIQDHRADRAFALMEKIGMAWVAGGMKMPGDKGAQHPPPSGDDTNEPQPSGVTVEGQVQTYARELLDLVDDDTWAKLYSVDQEIASDLRSALEQHENGEDDVRAALSAVMPRVQPHAMRFAPHLPQEAMAYVGFIVQAID